MHSYRSFFLIMGLFVPLSISCQPRLYRPLHAAALVAGNGSLEVRSGPIHQRVTALRDDVLRITIWRGNSAPEDASWAVPASIRHSVVPITQSREKDRVTMRTAVLNIEIDAKTLEITIRDQSGAIVQQDARPIHVGLYRLHPFRSGRRRNPLVSQAVHAGCAIAQSAGNAGFRSEGRSEVDPLYTPPSCDPSERLLESGAEFWRRLCEPAHAGRFTGAVARKGRTPAVLPLHLICASPNGHSPTLHLSGIRCYGGLPVEPAPGAAEDTWPNTIWPSSAAGRAVT